jgi:hypothetical protein
MIKTRLKNVDDRVLLARPYNAPLPELMSLRENDYMGQLSVMTSLLKVYDPTGGHARIPLAWP